MEKHIRPNNLLETAKEREEVIEKFIKVLEKAARNAIPDDKPQNNIRNTYGK
jgi:hypothetical protein